MKRRLIAVLLVAIGGMAGASARFMLGAVSGEALITTIAVNTGGSLLLALLLFGIQNGPSPRVRYLLGTGFFASFTTYSTFIADIALQEPTVAILYFLASYGSAFLAVVVGRESIRYLRDTGAL